jgi:hypothetical protein
MVLPHTWLLCVLELLKVIYRLVHFTFFLKACSRFSFCCTFHWNCRRLLVLRGSYFGMC